MSASQNYTVSGTSEHWTITTPDGITITPVGDAAGTLNVSINYTDTSLLNGAAHGILSVDIQPLIDKIATFGFHAPINLTVTNGMSVPIAGFDIMTYNDNGEIPTPVPQPGHPINYAHFHGPNDTPVPSTIFAPETITTELPTFTPSTADTPSIILASGTLAPGASVTASLELHNEEIAGDKNGFGFSFFPTGTDTSQAVIAGLAPTEQTDGVPPFLPFINTNVTDTNALPIEATTITVKDASNTLTDADVLSGAGLVHTGVGTYALSPTLPSDLNTELHALQFKEVSPSDTLTLSVDNSQNTILPATASTVVTLFPSTSVDGSTIVTDGPTLTDASAEKWSIVNGQAAVNGVIDPTTHRVVAMGYANGQIWQENADKNWWSKTSSSDAWTQGTPPASIANVVLQVSANNTVLPVSDQNQSIVDAGGNTWSFIGGQVSINGQPDPQTGHGQALAYENGEVWENADNLWWAKSSPSAPWLPAQGTPVSPVTGLGVSPGVSQAAPSDTIAVTPNTLGTNGPSFLQSPVQPTTASPTLNDVSLVTMGVSAEPPSLPVTMGATTPVTPTMPSMMGSLDTLSNPMMVPGASHLTG